VKSHDYHIFMERLIPVTFCGYLNDDVWKALAEKCHFYRQLHAKDDGELEKYISVLFYKLEKIFSLGWFNPM
jgi:hypothetical protein